MTEGARGWTLDTLKDLMDERDRRYTQRFLAQETTVVDALAAHEKAVMAAMAAADKAVTKAETAAEKRMDSVNEFRGQLRDQAETFLPRVEAETRFIALAEKVDDLRARADSWEGRAMGANAIWGYVVGAFGAGGVVAFLIAHFVK